MVKNLDELKNTSNSYLVISAIGDDSLHKEWVSGGNRTFDIILISYEDGEVYDTDIDFIIKQKGQKYPMLKGFIKNNKDLIRKYSYIWLPDDDLSISTDGINRLFDISEQYGLYISQPSLSGHASHDITLRVDDTGVRFTNFVEVMGPLFKSEILLKLYRTFDENPSSFGLDYLWPYLLGYPEDKIAIIDDVNMVHVRPLGIYYNRHSRSPLLDLDILLKKYGIQEGYHKQ